MKGSRKSDQTETRRLVELGVKKAGSKRQLALALGLSGQTAVINQYISGGLRIPPERLEKLTKLLEEPEPEEAEE